MRLLANGEKIITQVTLASRISTPILVEEENALVADGNEQQQNRKFAAPVTTSAKKARFTLYAKCGAAPYQEQPAFI